MALDAPLRVLRRDGLGYGDQGYMPELIDDPGLARRFFEALKKAFAPQDPGLQHILYGSDWIMLAQEKHADRYPSALRRNMRDASYGEAEIDSICWANARRYMKLQ